MRSSICLAIIAVLSCCAGAQPAPAAHAGQPFNATLAYGANYDSSSGTSSEMDTDVGFGFARRWSLHSGVPLFLFQQVTNGTTTTRASGVGDAYVALGYEAKNNTFHYTNRLSGTAPTGDKSLGFSSGRATAGLSNRLSHDFGPIEPFGEVGIGSGSEALSGYLRNQHGRSLDRPYTSLGWLTVWRAGAGVPIGNKVDLEGSFYDVAPFGDQKLYSRNGSGKSSSTSTSGQHGRQFELAQEVTGTSAIAVDRGLAADLDVNPMPHLEFDLSVGRSLHYAMNTVSFTVAYHFGGAPVSQQKK